MGCFTRCDAICDILSVSVFVFALNDESSEYPESHAGASAQPHAHALARTAIEENLVLDIVRICTPYLHFLDGLRDAYRTTGESRKLNTENNSHRTN